jgi:hypothetical protein
LAKTFSSSFSSSFVREKGNIIWTRREEGKTARAATEGENCIYEGRGRPPEAAEEEKPL